MSLGFGGPLAVLGSLEGHRCPGPSLEAKWLATLRPQPDWEGVRLPHSDASLSLGS